MENLSFKDQLFLFYSTDIILSPHGSALVNTLFSVPRSVAIECNPPYFFEAWYTNTVMLSRVHYIWLSTYYPHSPRSFYIKAERAYRSGTFQTIYRRYVHHNVNPPKFLVLGAVKDAVEYLKRWRFVYEFNDKFSPLFF